MYTTWSYERMIATNINRISNVGGVFSWGKGGMGRVSHFVCSKITLQKVWSLWRDNALVSLIIFQAISF